jgi:putative ABC transport system permease protein
MLVRLALRNLARNRRRTVLTLAALAVGIAAITGVRGFLNGLQSTLIHGVTEGGIGALQVHKQGYMASREGVPLTPSFADDPALYARLAAVDGVVGVVPRIPFAGLVADGSGDKSGLAIIVGADLAREGVVSKTRKSLVVDGAWPTGATDVAVSVELARALGLAPGKKVAVLSNDKEGVLNGVDLVVAGTLSAPTMAEKKLLVVPLLRAQELLRMPGEVTEVALAVDDDKDIDVVKANVAAVVGAGYDVHTWKELMPFADDARRTQDAALRIVTVAFLFVVLMGVANTLLMNVLERTREIGTLLALGMKRRRVLALFLLEGAFTAVGGAVVGSAVGAALVAVLHSNGVYLRTAGASAKQLIVPFLTWDFPVVVGGIVVVGALLASLLPALRASRLDPVAALSDR